ncbi:hypothetical protein Holit_01593 [Hollandina sp. SP2]
MRIQLDGEDEGVEKYIESEAERLGISLEEAAKKVGKRYIERQNILIESKRPEIETEIYEEKGTGTLGR